MRVDYFWTRKVHMGNEDECWPFQGCTNHNGYGWYDYSLKGKDVRERAHRLAWKLSRGPIPAGMVVCHRCDNPVCCNPDHLFLGTHLDNYEDAQRKGRMDHAKRKLSDGQVREMRRLREREGYGAKKLAKLFDCSVWVARDVINFKTYKWVVS